MKKLLSIFLISTMSGIIAAPTRSMLGIDRTEGANDDFPENPTAADYIQDGLVAMWDGIENVGWGEHDDESTVWKDLIGGNDATLTDNGLFGDDALICMRAPTVQNTYAAYAEGEPYPLGKTYVECVFQYDGGSLSRSLLFALRGFANNNNSNIRCVGFQNLQFSWGCAASGRMRGFSGVLPGMRYSVSGNLVNSALPAELSINGNGEVADLGGKLWLYVPLNFTTFGGGNLNNSNTSFVGSLNCIRIYSRILTPAEVLYNYRIDKIRFNLP